MLGYVSINVLLRRGRLFVPTAKYIVMNLGVEPKSYRSCAMQVLA
jgi:hypothetical protein